MTRFDFESTDLARFDRRMLDDVGFVDGEDPHPARLRRLPARAAGLPALVNALLSRMSLAVTTDRLVR